jgi:hypothetical protein
VLEPDTSTLRSERETNLFGPIAVTTAFATRLPDTTGAVVTIASVASWIGRIPRPAAIHLPHRALDMPIRHRDAIALALAEEHLSRSRPDVADAEHVRELVRRLLPASQASLVTIARAMALHPRVLQRWLTEEGTSFGEVLDDVRRNTAWSPAPVSPPRGCAEIEVPLLRGVTRGRG